MEKVSLKPSTRRNKKYMAIFEKNGKEKIVHFGQKGYEDFTTHKDAIRKENYIARHGATQKWKYPYSPGTLSRFILWNKPTLEASFQDYKRRFGFR